VYFCCESASELQFFFPHENAFPVSFPHSCAQ
jgi:hypothetical protein